MNKNTKEIWKVVNGASDLKVGDRVRYMDYPNEFKAGYEEDDLRFVRSIIDEDVATCDIEGALMYSDIFEQNGWPKIEVCINNKIGPAFLKKIKPIIKKTKEVKVLIHVLYPHSKTTQNAWFEIKSGLSTVALKFESKDVYGRKYDCIRAAKKMCKDLGINPVFEITYNE